MHFVWGILSFLVFVGLLVLGIQAVISLTWSFGWLVLAIVIGLALADLLDIGSALGLILFVILIICIFTFLV